MRAGRKKTARNLVIVRGNPGKRPIGEEPVLPTVLTELPEPPDWLEPYAKDEWRKCGPELVALELLDNANLTNFAAYCQSYARWRAAEEFLTNNNTNVMVLKDENGKVRYVQALPQVAISNQERKQMRAFATEFGMTPNSFAALKLERPGLSPEEELERLISS